MRAGERKLPELFRPGRIGRFATKNLIKYGACCVSNYNTRDGFISKRELARTKVIAGTGCGIITNQGAYPDPLGEGKAYFRQIAEALYEMNAALASVFADQCAAHLRHAADFGAGAATRPVEQLEPMLRMWTAASRQMGEFAASAARSIRSGPRS